MLVNGLRCEPSLERETFDGTLIEEIENESVEALLTLALSSCEIAGMDSVLSPLLMATVSSSC